MGNESSKLKGLIIDKSAVEANDFWALYNAESPTTSNVDGRQLLSVFQGEAVVKGQLWVTQGPMERAIKNLRIYRHPYILKYVATWEENGQKHLATERVRPLADVLAAQSDLQVCLGLRNILCSLIFLVEKATARHMNICTQSIYITDNGSWRLAGFEYVWKTKELNKQLLDLARAFRNHSAIDEAEKEDIVALEQFAFATLCEQILEKCDNSTPHVQEFRNYCSTHLKHQNTQLRPRLSAVLLHPYFNHEFVLIHSFLFELPLKSVQERQQFFTSLIDRLRYFNEQVVASQLAANLLSRMVLLDPTAQLCVTPYVLRTKTEVSAALFTQQTFTDYILPHILKMFRIRDAQIRLILLEYFMEYVRLLSDDQLQSDILPHLLAGMQDTNDVLVAKTLRCMADLVPILGAATVLGGQRTRLFSDGRPHAAVSDTTSTQHWIEPRSITPVMNGCGAVVDDYMVSGSPIPTENGLSSSFNSLPQLDDTDVVTISMPLRLSPDGGEDNKSAITLDKTTLKPNSKKETVEQMTNIVEITNDETTVEALAVEDDDDAWSDWDTSDELRRLSSKTNRHHEDIEVDGDDNRNVGAQDLLLGQLETNSSSSHTTQATQISQSDSFRTAYSNQSTATTNSTNSIKKNIDDLNALDIQVQMVATTTNAIVSKEFDFFKDMEPIIEPNKRVLTADIGDVKIDSSRFAAAPLPLCSDDDDTIKDGWGADDDVDTLVWATNSATAAT